MRYRLDKQPSVAFIILHKMLTKVTTYADKKQYLIYNKLPQRRKNPKICKRGAHSGSPLLGQVYQCSDLVRKIQTIKVHRTSI